jgi:hypothetical protein
MVAAIVSKLNESVARFANGELHRSDVAWDFIDAMISADDASFLRLAPDAIRDEIRVEIAEFLELGTCIRLNRVGEVDLTSEIRKFNELLQRAGVSL